LKKFNFCQTLRETRGEIFDKKKSSRKYMEFMEIHSILDADSEYHVSFEFEGKIKKLLGDDLLDF